MVLDPGNIPWPVRQCGAGRQARRHRPPFHHGPAESVFATLECERFDQQPGGRLAARREAELAVFVRWTTWRTGQHTDVRAASSPSLGAHAQEPPATGLNVSCAHTNSGG